MNHSIAMDDNGSSKALRNQANLGARRKRTFAIIFSVCLLVGVLSGSAYIVYDNVFVQESQFEIPEEDCFMTGTCDASKVHAIPGQIEAEEYAAMGGVRVINCDEGGKMVGHISSGDYMLYRVYVDRSGPYDVQFRVATLATKISFTVSRNNDQTLASIVQSTTGSWQKFKTVQQRLILPAGTYNLVLKCTGWKYNINWLKFDHASEDNTTPNAAEFVSQEVPSVMKINSKHQITIRFRNIGIGEWDKESGHRIGSQNPRDNTIWGTSRVLLGSGDTVQPGGTQAFVFEVTAPSTPGTYNIQWRMLDELPPMVGWFGAYSDNVAVVVKSFGTTNPCLPDPCLNGGSCSISNSMYSCDCTGTGYKGDTCQMPENHSEDILYKRSDTFSCSKQTCEWISPTINTAGSPAVVISAGTRCSTIGIFENNDYLKMWYNINGGDWVRFFSKTVDWEPNEVRQSVVNARNTMQIKIEAKTSMTNEIYYVENLTVSKQKDECPNNPHKVLPGLCGCDVPEGSCNIDDDKNDAKIMQSCGSLGNTDWTMGPLVGHTTSTTTIIWAHFPNKSMKVWYWAESNASNKVTRALAADASGRSSRVRLTGLTPLTAYRYHFLVNDQQVGAEGRFRTAPGSLEPTEFTYIFGSGIREQRHPVQYVWARIMQENPDFLLLNGDNVYLYQDNTDYKAVMERHWKQRSRIPTFNECCSKMPTYAVWDDHDFGPNNSDGTHKNKVCSRMGFKHVWANPSTGESDKGTYSTFRWGNVQFFLMDNRYFKIKDRIYIGSTQMSWLKRNLIQAQNDGIVFKIIVHGGTIRRGGSESWFPYESERDEIYNLIRDNPITGVLWNGGDIHTNKFNPYPMCPRTGVPQYDVFEIISSGMSYDKHKYTKVTINTKATDPSIVYRFFDRTNGIYVETWRGKFSFASATDKRMKHTVENNRQGYADACQGNAPTTVIGWP